MTDCLFCRIVGGELPATIIHETDLLLAFRDISPQAPTHVLVIPKRHLASVPEVAESDPALLAELINAAVTVAKSDGLESYRLVANTGEESGQTVFHAHVHVLGGKRLGHLV